MSHRPIAEGVRAAFRSPGLILAEITWRWCFGIAAWTLIVLTCREYLDSVRFTAADWALVRTRQPLLVAEGVAHALQGSGPRLIRASIIIAVALVVLWMFAASVGRAATLKALLTRQTKTGFGSLVGLNFLRAALTLAAILGYLAVLIFAGRVAPVDPNDTNALLTAVLLFLLFGVVVAFFWSLLNWFLSVAPIFVVQNGRDTWGAVADSVSFFRRRSGPLLGVSLVFDLLKLVLIAVATIAAIAPFPSIQSSASLWSALWIALGVALLYFAAADVLYVARLAIYVHVAEQDLEPAAQQLAASS